MEKKRKREKKNEDEMEIEEEENEIQFDINNNNNNNELINVEFTFSNIVEDNFQLIKVLIQPNFEFEDVYVGDLSDILISQHEDVGTTIKVEENIFGVFSYIPISFYREKKLHKNFIEKFYKFLNNKIEKYYDNNKNKENFLNILNNSNNNIGLVINERAMNLAEETIPPAMGLITKEINECKEMDDYDKRYDFDYFIILSKFVKILDNKKHKKTNLDDNNNIAYYKFEYPLFLKKCLYNVEYKIPFEEKDMSIRENKNEPQFMSILIIESDKYFKILKNELNCEF
jgi:hypothetical protein